MHCLLSLRGRESSGGGGGGGGGKLHYCDRVLMMQATLATVSYKKELVSNLAHLQEILPFSRLASVGAASSFDLVSFCCLLTALKSFTTATGNEQRTNKVKGNTYASF